MRLYVNVDHVATVREARGTDEPDPVRAAVLVELAGAHGITVHLREDRRHVSERDVRLRRSNDWQRRRATNWSRRVSLQALSPDESEILESSAASSFRLGRRHEFLAPCAGFPARRPNEK